ncbi:MAG: hypothetical protein WKG32_05090 [Gemmatimonadaceae bacterium]
MRHPASLLALAVAFAASASAPARAQSVTSSARPWPDSAWRQIGPAALGGRVDDIEAVAGDPRIIFVGSASGGLFRTRNNGVTWEPVLDSAGTALSVGDIAIAPSDPDVVWVGTGEPNNRQSSTWGDGVYRSVDGGSTWRHMGLRETQSIGRVVIDPHDANVVFVAAVGHLWGPNEERGLYKTRDGGGSWQKVLGIDANTGVTDVAMSPDGRTLLAASYGRRRRAFGFAGGGPNSAIWRSVDGGDSWQRVTAGLPTGVTGRIGLDVSRSDPRVAYAVVEHRQQGGVYRSTDSGATWTRQNPLNDRPSYYSQIRVHPTNADRVWLLGTFVHHSADAGKTFVVENRAKIHPDNHALWIDPSHPDHMLLGTDGGVYATYDGGRRWDFVENLPLAQFYDIDVDAREPYWIYGGLQDNGTVMFPSGTYSRGPLTDAQVAAIGFGDGFQVAVDRTDPRFVYTNSQNGRGYITDLVTRQEKRITPVSPNRRERYRFNWNTAILLSSTDPRVFYFGSNTLLRTTDRGATWREISPDLTRRLDWRTLSVGEGFVRDSTTPSRDDGVSEYGNITTIGESPRARGLLLVGTDDGNVQMTTDGGAHWTDLTARFGLSAPRGVSKVLPSRHSARVAYVAFDGHTDDDMRPYLFRTDDGGATWRSIAGFPDGVVVRTLAEDPVNRELLFAGTEFGLYYSPDGGERWLRPPGLPRVSVTRVLVHEGTRDLVLATHGRGVIVLDDIGPWEEGGAPDARARLFPPRPATQIYRFRDQPPAGDRRFTAPNTPAGALLTYAIPGSGAPGIPSDSAARARLQIVRGDGRVVRDLDAPGGAGVHRVAWDLRTQLPLVPAPADSGYYGAPRAPLVPPGRYTVRLIARSDTVTQPLEVRADPRAPTTPGALRARAAIVARIDTLVRVAAGAKRTLAEADSELVRLSGLAGGRTDLSPSADSLLRAVRTEIVALRARFAEGYSAPIGQVFDLLGGLESRAAAPTEAERRVLSFAESDIADGMRRLHEVTTVKLPRLRALMAP